MPDVKYRLPSVCYRRTMRLMRATQKQINYALRLLGKAGYSTKYMNASFKLLGATMRERSGRVEDWLGGKNVAELSALIDRLKSEQPAPKADEDPEVQALRKSDTDELRKIAGLPETPETH